MKKHLSLYVLLAALCFTLSPQKARAQVDEYLKVVGTTTFYIKVTGTVDEFPDLWYSYDKTSWTQITGATNWNTPSASSTVTYFKGHNPNGFNHSSTNFVSIAITGGNPTLAGNVMSLLGDDFSTNKTIPCDYCFYGLFTPYPPSSFSSSYSYSSTSTSTSLRNARDLVLPATNLKAYCYAYMFAQNTSLYSAPKLPATVMAPWCYARMFEYCTSLYGATAKNSGYYLSELELPSQQLAEGCYAFMFNRCSGLVNDDYYILPAEELAPKCYMGMFGLYNAKCTTLKYVEIMATSLQDRYGNDITNCLAYMFNNAIAAKSGSSFLYGRGSLNLRFYWLNWGAYNGTGYAGDGPTQSWFYGSPQGASTFLYQSGLTPTTKGASESTYATKMYCNPFPYSSTLTAQNFTYLTFNCAANDGTWEEGSAYNTDLRRVVRADYTAKTIPAPPVKENARFLGWFTSASGDGEMLTEEQLKQITTATTVYARFVDNDKYTFFVNPSDKGTITVTDNNGTSYTPGTLYVDVSNELTFTLSCTGVASGYSFYQWSGGQVDGNEVSFREGQKDLVITGIITENPTFDAASATVYQVGTGAGISNKIPLPSEAVDLGDAGIWAKYNVDKTTANGFATSETAMGSYFAWGMITQGASTTGNFYDASSMVDGQDVPVTEETDAAYKYCGPQWRVPTKDEFQTLLDNTTQSTVNYYNQTQTLTSNTNGNTIKLANNGYTSSVAGAASMTSVINYWTRTLYSWNTSSNSSSKAWGYRGGMYGNSTVYPPVLSYQDGSGNTSVSNQNQIYYGCGIRPILNVNKRILTIHAAGYDYVYECNLNQEITITAIPTDGYYLDRWEDSEGNLYSEDNPLTIRMYDNQEYTAIFEAGTLIKHHVTFYDEDGSTVLYEDDYREERKPVYRGETPTKSGYVFNGWSPAITILGTSDTYYTATYLKTYSITTTAAHGTVELTPASPTDQVSEGVYKTGTSLTMTVTADPGYVFTQWSDGNTQNPRTVSVTADASYTAEFRLESLPATVDAYQSAPADVKQILYLLASQTGNDSKIYRPVDMGNGLAWANKNVGANDSIDNGSFFYWGGTTAVTTAATSAYYTGLTSMSTTASYDATQYPLPAAADAATVNMGERWRMPTLEEIYYLAEETGCTESGAAASGFFYTNNDDGKKIFIPSAGCYKSTTRTTGVTLFWGSTVSYKSTYQSRPAYYLSGVSNAGTTSYYAYYALPVRAVYVPAYTPVTLTINAGERQYIYYCQPGQQVTVTAHPNTSASYLFDEWEDNHSTNPERTFTVTDNATYTAKMKDNPEAASYSVTFQDYDGTTLQAAYSLIDGRVPVYSGAEPSRKGYRFTGWTDGNDVFTDKDTALPAIAGNVVYTATYVKEPYLTITNTHASANTSVSMRKSNKSMANKTFYIRIINAAGEVTTNWTTKNVNLNNTNAVSFGSIPAGGKMQIYGNGSFTANSSYYDYFVISGGTPEISGNILSLVACSDGETVDNNYSLPTYCFRYLFYNCTALTNAEDLELPSTTVPANAYYYMFYGCTNLKKAPKELPATTLGTNCYYYMFYNCSTMVSAPERLPALTLPASCYFGMFQNCNALTTAPEIDATSVTGTQTCYNMFYGCRALTKAPSQLKIATLQTNTYYYMFNNCTSLKRSPDIRATTLASQALNSMFDGCTSLDTIRTYQTAWGYSNYWVRNVANTGVIYCPPTLAREYDGTNFNKMPKSPTYKWTVYSYNVTFNPVGCAWTDATSSNKQFTWQTDVDNVIDFLDAEAAADATFYTDAECTKEISVEAIKAYLEEQQEASAETTKNYYVRKVSAYELSWDANEGELSGDYTAAGSVNAGATITAPTATRTGYTFMGWSPDFTGTMPAANTEYVAQWEINKYTVTIAKNEDDWGSLTDESENVRVINNVPYGTAISNSGATVTINGTTVTATPAAATAQYTYGFDSWTNGTETVTGDMTVTVNFTRTTNTYDITWKSEDGTSTLETDEAQAYGTTTAYNGDVPTKSATGYTYAFDGWATEANGAKVYNIGETPTVSGTATYYAHFTGTANTHTLIWVANGGTLTGGTAAGTTAYGTALEAPTATREGYTFNGWSPSVPATMPDDDATYTAQWKRIEYTITYNGLNGATNSNNPISYNIESETITLADPGTRDDYIFAGWKDKSDNTITQIAKGSTGNLTLTATWNAKSSDITLCENCNNNHYNTFKTNYNGETVNVTYNRQFKASKWSTMCLPFSIELPELIAQKMYGRVYEFKYATGNANTNSGVNLYFSNAKKIEAGKCYIVNANDALAEKTSFVFSGVTIDLTKDNGADLSSPETPEASMAAYNALPGYKSEGTIELVGTLRNGTLHGTTTGNRYMGLKDNKIYYPNISQGSTIWAYRGIFRSTETLNIEKMRIIVDGEDMGELIIDEDGEILDASGNAESRKFIENGILYIEREGVIYDAQGKRVESSF
ncbi:MAG: InlB B-repeat-containing protein [Paludibacteraceae bacterium]|nr:InlB B-repeat-containing protein [Paludibacteraceae bacterium]